MILTSDQWFIKNGACGLEHRKKPGVGGGDVGKGFPSNNISRAADTRIPLLPADQAGTLQE